MVSLASTILSLTLACSASAQSVDADVIAPPAVDAELAIRFADHLLRGDDPFNALTWYRLGSFLSEEPRPGAELRAAWCYELGSRYDAAEAAYIAVGERYPQLAEVTGWRAAMASRAAGRVGMARVYLQEISLDAPGTPAAARAQWMEALLAIEQGQDAYGAAHLDVGGAYAARSAETLARLQAPYRVVSPTGAGVMSAVLPGSGQVYAGHWGDGVMALLTTAGSGALSYTLLRYGAEEDRGWAKTAGVSFGTLSGFFWASEVLGAVRGAQRANRLSRSHHLDEVFAAAITPDLEVSAEAVDTSAWPA
ncbi:MAG: hypothetical protein JXX28_11110, partial [Deltaproteobacteria bacterium]|nr:hypothetical protein [Deltaproteobacteria bacterium]